jgi:hypothetical protein
VANPFVFRKSKKRHRLTDIQTEEVSLVDKGANKRKFAVIKSDTETNEMTKLNAEATLQAVTTGLTTLSELTEVVKTFVEKAEAGAEIPVEDWTKTIQSFMPWMNQVLETLGVKEEGKSTVTTETVAAATETTSTETVVAPGATDTTVVSAAETTTNNTTVTTTPAVETTTTETVVVAPETTVTTTTETPVTETVTTTTATETLGYVTKAVLDLAATVPTLDNVKKAGGLFDRLFMSGGLFIDTYDIEALAMVCNAIVEAHHNSDDGVEKSADKILGEISKRTVAVAKRIEKAEKPTSADGKELKVVSMLLKTLEDALEKQTSTATETTQVIDKAAIEKMVNDAVATATKGVTEQTAALKQQITKLETEKAEVQKKLTAALETPAARASSQETVTKGNTTPAKQYNVNRNGIVDYNEAN